MDYLKVKMNILHRFSLQEYELLVYGIVKL